MRVRVPLLLIVAACAAVPALASNEGQLRGRIHSGRAHERALAGAAAHLARLERATAREVAILSRRVADAQAELDTAVARQQATAVRLDAARPREPPPRRARAQPTAGRAPPRCAPGRPWRPLGDPVACRPVRIRRPEPPAQLRDRVWLLPDHRRHLARPRRLDPPRLPGLQDRAG